MHTHTVHTMFSVLHVHTPFPCIMGIHTILSVQLCTRTHTMFSMPYVHTHTILSMAYVHTHTILSMPYAHSRTPCSLCLMYSHHVLYALCTHTHTMFSMPYVHTRTLCSLCLMYTHAHYVLYALCTHTHTRRAPHLVFPGHIPRISQDARVSRWVLALRVAVIPPAGTHTPPTGRPRGVGRCSRTRSRRAGSGRARAIGRANGSRRRCAYVRESPHDAHGTPAQQRAGRCTVEHAASPAQVPSVAPVPYPVPYPVSATLGVLMSAPGAERALRPQSRVLTTRGDLTRWGQGGGGGRLQGSR